MKLTHFFIEHPRFAVVLNIFIALGLTGCAGVAVMGGVMRAADPGLEVGALVATLQGVYPRAR